MTRRVVLDASVMVEILGESPTGILAAERIADSLPHVPCHFEAEVLSALGRIHRAGQLSAGEVEARLRKLSEMPAERHELTGLLAGAWGRRNNLRLADALYIELAVKLGCEVITTDARLAAAAPEAQLVAD